jgi:hypothetical protein
MNEKLLQSSKSDAMLKRSKNYSALVKELHWPMRNKKLLHEVESRISEATQSRRSTDFGLSMSKRDYMEKVSEHVRSGRTSPNRRKFKPNSMMPL